MTVILADFSDPYVQQTKRRRVDIFKNEVYKDIDLYTHKHVDASQTITENRARNAVSSDTHEDVDSAVIARLVEFRDAQLRRRIRFALAPWEQEFAADPLTLEDNRYHYYLSVPVEFDDNNLEPLAEYIHRFLVFGALCDWYGQMGMQQQASYYGSQMEQLEDDIASALRGPSIVKRPLQPFGPAQKMY